MATTKRWSPEKIEAMRRELLEGGATLRSIAEHESCSYQWINRLVGSLNRGNSRSKAKQEQVRLLVEAGLSDKLIAVRMGIGHAYVKDLRQRSGILRPHPNKKWTCRLILEKARGWHEQFDQTPSAQDWNPSFLKANNYFERLERFYEFGAPSTTLVQKYFGSWSEMIRQSGLSPAPRGGAAHGRYKLEQS